jgi:endonuclease-3
MPRYDEQWVAEHSGPVTPRRMSAILTRLAGELGHAPGKLAVTKVARRKDPFHVLVACIISLRTKDEVTDEAAPRLLKVAPTPGDMMRLTPQRIGKLIYPAGFYRTKGATLKKLSRVLVEEHEGVVPNTMEGLLRLDGVGRKTANLVLTLGHGKPGICVDVHVHRISNRIGFAETSAPDDTEHLLRARLPRRWWVAINDLLVTWGRTVCRPTSPFCSSCVVADLCHQRGVTRHR